MNDNEFPIGVRLGRWTIVELLAGEPSRGRYRANGPDGLVGLLTVAPAQKLDHAELSTRHAMASPRIAALVQIGTLATTVARYDGMIEIEPSGRPLREVGCSLGVVRELCDVVRDAHARGLVVRGLRPELVYIDDSARITAIAPRCEAFLMTSTPASMGVLHCFDHYYMAPEALNVRPSTPAADVFSLAAFAVEAITGQHPFVGDNSMEQLMSVTGGTRRAWQGDARLQPILDRALARDPTTRPSLDELARSLS
jgi:hypothetical protein